MYGEDILMHEIPENREGRIPHGIIIPEAPSPSCDRIPVCFSQIKQYNVNIKNFAYCGGI